MPTIDSETLNETIETMGSYLDSYRFAEAYELLYHFVWDDVADWYIEASKTADNTSVLAHVLDAILKIAHPFAPFVTEAIWQTLERGNGSLLCTEEWPKPIRADEHKAADFAELQAIITESRTIVKTLAIREGHLYYTDVSFLKENAELITRMAHLAGVQEVEDGTGLHLTSNKTPLLD